VGPLALHLAASLTGVVPLSTLPSVAALLVAGTATSCALALCLALAPRQESGGAFAALAVAGGLGAFGLMTGVFTGDRHLAPWAFLHPAGGLSSLMLAVPSLWQRMVLGAPSGYSDYATTLTLTPLLSVVASLVVGALLVGAACRKLRAPQLPLLSKRQALALFAAATAAQLVPYELTGWSLDDDVAAGLTIVMLPLVVLLGLLATPTFEAWAMALRRGGRRRWSADDAAPHRLVWRMEALWLLALVAMHGHDIARGLHIEPARPMVVAWGVLTAVTLPVYLSFVSTRYSSAAARWAFGVALFAHLLCQLIAIAMVHHADDQLRTIFTIIAAVAAVAVPAWVLWRQQVLRRQTLA
jgi:hypothetical protein